jgi:phage tail-like protein
MPIAKSEVPSSFDEKLAVSMRFKVTLDGFEGMSHTNLHYWTQVSGINQKFAVVTYQSADHYNFKTQVPGMADWDPVVLQRALTAEDAAATMVWLKTFSTKHSPKLKGTMEIKGYTAWGDPGGEWRFTGVWPKQWDHMGFNTGENKPAMEKLTLVHDGLVNSD